MVMLIDSVFPFLEGIRRGFGDSQVVCFKVSVLPDTVRRIASIGTWEVRLIFMGSQKEKVLAGWTDYTISFLYLLNSMHAIN